VISVTARGGYEATGAPHEYQKFYLQLARSAAALGLELREEWVKTPPLTAYIGEREAERFGYASIRTLWQERERPAGLLVFTDVAARGVLMGLLELRVNVPRELRLVLHRNAEVGLLCPFPAAYVDVQINAVAGAMIDLVARQYRGDAVSPVRLPYTLDATLA
jgi:DNA-binding LacI/PurR family transcriptional regulator